MTSREIAIENIRRVAHKLGPLRERAVFLGGSVTALLITDPGAPDVRPTKDVDAVVQTASLAESIRLDEELRELGFQHCMDPGAPICRWIVDGCLVDIVPVGVGINAYNDHWSPAAIEQSERLELEEGLTIRHVSAPYFVAIKLETFAGADVLLQRVLRLSFPLVPLRVRPLVRVKGINSDMVANAGESHIADGNVVPAHVG